MAIKTKNVHNALVLYDDATVAERWYDAFGEGVTKYVTSFASLPADDTTTDPTEFAVTVVEAGAGVSTAVINDTAGGALIITTAADEDDGWSMQLGNPNLGRSISFASDYPMYFGIQFQINDVDNTDCLFGLAVTDTAMLGGVTDGMYFRSVDASAVLNFVLEKDSIESTTAVNTMADATDVTCEWYFDGEQVTAWINDVQVAQIARTDASFPNDELLRLSLEFLTGEDVANTCLVKWIRMIQIVA